MLSEDEGSTEHIGAGPGGIKLAECICSTRIEAIRFQKWFTYSIIKGFNVRP